MKIFIAGAKSISSLDSYVIQKLRSICDHQHDILIGDCQGVDTLVQQFFHEAGYSKVTIYASNGKARNNVGNWPVKNVPVADSVRGFAFYRQKDLAMAQDADCGFMIWDGKSKGTHANIKALAGLGKKVVVHFPSTDRVYMVLSEHDIPRQQETLAQLSMLS